MVKKQIRQLNRRKVILKSDAISLDAVDDLVESGFARRIFGLALITKAGRRAEKLSYGRWKWLKKGKKEKGSDKAKGSHRRKPLK